MGRLLTHGLAPVAALAAVWAHAGEIGEDHSLRINAALSYPSVDSDLSAWPSGGLSKLRFDESDSGLAGNHLLAEYRGRLADTIWVNAVLDYNADADTAVGLTEAYIDWRPVPQSANQHRFRFGAFYPPFSLENGDFAWTSPFGVSFSAINAWLAEEIRPIGAEWTLRRKLGFAGSPHEIASFAAAFFGNDPAGTLLFWRGFGLHDRQTRLNERLALPALAVGGPGAPPICYSDCRFDAFTETDHEPGFYAGAEWRLRNRVSLQLAYYDNRADPTSFSDGEWGWDTAFWHIGAQVELPAGLGLIVQLMDGRTDWLTLTTGSGQTTPSTELVRDAFDSYFITITKRFNDKHRLSLRRDEFDFRRLGTGITIDSGDALSISYEYRLRNRLRVIGEWLNIDSSRDLWPMLFALPQSTDEQQLRLQFIVDVLPGG